jgi:hypothetical protein
MESSGMMETRPKLGRFARLIRRKRFWFALALPPVTIAGICGWLTEPFESAATSPGSVAKPSPGPAPTHKKIELGEWPTSPMGGRPAMGLLLDSLRDAKLKLQAAGAYTAVLHKTERMNGTLGAKQILEMKCRHKPFAVYETVLDRFTDEAGREWLRSVHTHPHQKPDRPFQVVEVLYDAGTRIPIQIKSYDWQPTGEQGDPKLAEAYQYDELKLGAELTDADFDPANPAYAFSRF